MGEPQVSVLIIAYRRKEYLRNAVISVLDQNLGKDSCEILTVVGFRDLAFEAWLKEKGVRVFYDERPDLGPKFANLVRESRSEILAFLEDDDAFAPGKLRSVIDHFRDDPSLVFLHNGFTVVDAAGQKVSDHPLHRGERRARHQLGEVVLQSPGALARLKALPPLAPEFNNSSISVRRSLLLPRLGTLEKDPLAVDHFLFYSALLSGEHLRIIPDELTLYRLHRDNTVFQGSLLSLYEKSYSLVSEMTAGAADPEVSQAAEAFHRAFRISVILREPGNHREEMRQAWRDFQPFRKTYLVGLARRLRPVVCLYLLSPGLARRLAQREYNRLWTAS